MLSLSKVQWGVGLAVLALAGLAPVSQVSAGDHYRGGRSYGFGFSYNSGSRCDTVYRPTYVYRDCGPRYVPSYSYSSCRPSYGYSRPSYSRGYSYGGFSHGHGNSWGHGGSHHGRGGHRR